MKLIGPLARSKLRTILDHVLNVFCRGDERLASELHHSIAHTLRLPWIKIPRASVFNGIEGTGKSAFWNEFVGKRLMGLGRHWMTTFNIEDVIGQWTGHLESMLYVFIEESDFNAANRQGTAKLQQAISGDTATFNEKYERLRVGYLYFSLIMMTNYAQPISPNITNRRFVFYPCLDVRHWNKPERDTYFKELTAALFSDDGARQYWSYLLTLKVDEWRESAYQNGQQSYYTMDQVRGLRRVRGAHWRRRSQQWPSAPRPRRCTGCSGKSSCATLAWAACSSAPR